MTLEMGKSLAESRAEITYAAEFMRWFSEEAVRITGATWSTRPAKGGSDDATVGGPLFDPRELPTAMGTQVAPAIAADARWCKAPPADALSVFAAKEILEDAGLPGGVLSC
jgi:succinate-semialdehyde dehydrogenase/glutarate-semialdehyde dehydrogenase